MTSEDKMNLHILASKLIGVAGQFRPANNVEKVSTEKMREYCSRIHAVTDSLLEVVEKIEKRKEEGK